MTSHEDDDARDLNLLRQYLLGQLAPAARDQLEELLFPTATPGPENERVAELLQVAEDELIEDYQFGYLGYGDRRSLALRFSWTTKRREKLRLVTNLSRLADAKAEAVAYDEAGEALLSAATAAPAADEKRPFWRWPSLYPSPVWATAAAAVLLVAVASIAFQTGRLLPRPPVPSSAPTGMPSTMAQDPARAQPDAAPAAAAGVPLVDVRATKRSTDYMPPSPPGAAGLFAALLSSGPVERGSGGSVSVPSDATIVRLHLDIGVNEHDSYSAELFERLDEADRMIRAYGLLPAHPHEETVVVTLALEPELLRPGSYVVLLRGVRGSQDPEVLGRFYFSVPD